jgi:hypothetical protein
VIAWALGVAAVMSQQDVLTGNAELAGDRGMIRLRNFSRLTSDLVAGTMDISGSGGPLSIEDTGTGVRLVAKEIQCHLVRTPKGNWAIGQAALKGAVRVEMDSSFAVHEKTRNGIPAPKPSSITKIHLNSEKMDYKADAAEATLTFVLPVQMADEEQGPEAKVIDKQSVNGHFTQNTDVSGTSGVFRVGSPFDALPNEIFPRFGHLEGPVDFAINRVWSPSMPDTLGTGLQGLAPADTTHITGSGRQFDADFLGNADPTLTLAGNVKVEATGTSFTGSVSGDRGVIRLEPRTYRVKGYEFTGNPSKTIMNRIPPLVTMSLFSRVQETSFLDCGGNS